MSAGPTSVDVPPEIIEYLSGQQTLTLATASAAGVPRASTLLYVNDGPTIYFWTRPGSIAARHVEENSVVSFAIDSYSEDLSQTRGVQGIGECSVLLSGEQIARVADLFGQKFPKLSPGSTMSISFYRIAPTELQMIDNRTAPSMGRAGEFGTDFHRERSFSIVSGLPAQATDSVIASLRRLEAPAGETIVRQGGPADRFFILVEGAAEVLRDERQIATLAPGMLFGELAIMRGEPRSCSVRITTDATLLALERDTFRELVAQSLGVTVDFDEVIRSRLDALRGE
jgi:CRP-like cAMP-binding protein